MTPLFVAVPLFAVFALIGGSWLLALLGTGIAIDLLFLGMAGNIGAYPVINIYVAAGLILFGSCISAVFLSGLMNEHRRSGRLVVASLTSVLLVVMLAGDRLLTGQEEGWFTGMMLLCIGLSALAVAPAAERLAVSIFISLSGFVMISAFSMGFYHFLMMGLSCLACGILTVMFTRRLSLPAHVFASSDHGAEGGFL